MHLAMPTWSSKKQSVVALSTAESEYVALCSAVKECTWVRRVLKSLGQDVKHPTTVFEDNQAAIKISENPVDHRKTKHIDIQYHYTREAQDKGIVKVKYCPTGSMIADMLTKPLSKPKLEGFCRACGVIEEPEV